MSRRGIILLSLALGAVLLFTWQTQQKKRAEKKSLPTPAVSETGSRLQQLQKFKLTGFDEKGKTFWHLEGDAAKIDTQQTVFMDNNVTFRLQDNTVVKTDKVQWIQAEGILLTRAPVTVEHQNAHVSGTGAFGKPNESFIQLNRNIEMKIQPSTTVNCRGPLKIYYGKNRMIFYRNVRVSDSNGLLLADRMEVTFNAEDKKIKEILAVGKVVVERGSDTTRSERAIYTPSTGSVRFEGNPEITLHQKGAGLLDGTFRN